MPAMTKLGMGSLLGGASGAQACVLKWMGRRTRGGLLALIGKA